MKTNIVRAFENHFFSYSCCLNNRHISINKIKSSGIADTYRAIKNKLYYPMAMGYAAVGTISHKNEIYNLSEGTRVFTNSFHQEEALVDYNMCVKIPENVDNKSASFGAIGGIAMQSIKCII